MKTWFRLALRELLNHRGFSLFFLANLTIGLVGFIALDSFKLSLDQHISSKAKSLLAADLRLYASAPFSEAQSEGVAAALPPGTLWLNQVRFMSMVRGAEDSRLVEVIAVGRGYPFYGELTLEQRGTVGPQAVDQTLHTGQKAWVQPELLRILGLERGDALGLGDLSFEVDDALIDAPGQGFWSAGITYKVFISYEAAQKTGLLENGSRRWHNRLYRLPPGFDPNQVAQRIRASLEKRLGPAQPLRIVTPDQANRQMSRLVTRLNDYLGLVALVALFLAGLGTAFLFRNFLGSRLKELAILRALGAQPYETVLLSLIQISILGALSAVLASGLATLGLPLLTQAMADYLPLGFESHLSYRSMFLALVVGILGSALFCLPLLLGLLSISPKLLLSDQADLRQHAGISTWASAASYLPVVGLYWGLSVWQSQSLLVGSLFLGGLAGSAVILTGLGLVPLLWAGQGFAGLPLSWRLALRNLGRGGAAAVTSAVAIGLGALLINLIPQIHEGLATEIESPEESKLPSFFLFDIQPEQIGPLGEFIEAQGYRLEHRSAMVSARLTQINGEPVEIEAEDRENLTREERSARRMRRREQNLSYRAEPYESEELVEGRWFESTYDLGQEGLPQISLEERFADRLEVGVGGTLTFDVQGVPIQGRVVNLRRVRWNSFQPNFFVLFQPGVLEMAPSTFLATVPTVPKDDKVGLQARVSKRFPNVSLVDVTYMIKKLLAIAGQIRWAIQSMALLSLLAGLVVVYSISNFNAKSRETELNLLKILGASFGDLKAMTALEFGLLGFFASTAGALLSLGIAWGLAQFIFDRVFVMNLWITLVSIAAITTLSLATSLLATNRALAKSPAQLLQAI